MLYLEVSETATLLLYLIDDVVRVLAVDGASHGLGGTCKQFKLFIKSKFVLSNSIFLKLSNFLKFNFRKATEKY